MYSTYTLNLDENERMIDRFLTDHPDFVLEPISAVRLPAAFGAEIGVRAELSRAARLMPHTVPGEGHFVARLHRRDGDTTQLPLIAGAPLKGEQTALFRDFWRALFREEPWYEPVLRGDTVWLAPGGLEGAVRAGVPAGHFLRGRFEPDHALFMALPAQAIGSRVSLSVDDPRIAAFLRGEQISAAAEKGWCAVCVSAGGRDYPLGFGKASGGVVKNHYPKGLRNFK